MTTRIDTFVVNRVSNVVLTCGQCAWVLDRRASVTLMLCLIVNAVTMSRGLADDDDGVNAAPPAGERQFVFTEQQFDQMVFGGRQMVREAVVVPRVNGVQAVEIVERAVAQTSVADFRKRMESSVTYEIRAVVRSLSLTEAQVKKLQLAARGDIVQHINRAEDLRPRLTAKPLDKQQYIELMKELEPLRMAQQYGILGDQSLFRKTLRTILTDEQRIQLRIVERERQAAIIESALNQMERVNNGLKLTGETHRKFAEVHLEHGRVPQIVGPYGQYVVLLEANLLSDRVKPLLTESEWEKFELQVGQAKRVQPILESNRIWTARRSETNDEETDDEAKDR